MALWRFEQQFRISYSGVFPPVLLVWQLLTATTIAAISTGEAARWLVLCPHHIHAIISVCLHLAKSNANGPVGDIDLVAVGFRNRRKEDLKLDRVLESRETYFLSDRGGCGYIPLLGRHSWRDAGGNL